MNHSKILLRLKGVVCTLLEYSIKYPKESYTSMIDALEEVRDMLVDFDALERKYRALNIFDRFDAVTQMEDVIQHQEQLIKAYKEKIRQLENERDI